MSQSQLLQGFARQIIGFFYKTKSILVDIEFQTLTEEPKRRKVVK